MASSFYTRAGKRWFDAGCALLGIFILSPVLLVVALAIKLTSPGRVLFRQIRLGQFGKPFWMFKFRTMIATEAPGGSLLTASGDPRITPVGSWLRKTKIDEFPQLINVLIGDMSLVGPRPEVPEYTGGYSEEQKRVFSARPGITGPSINVYEEELLARQFDKEAFYLKTILPAKLEIDVAYVENISFGRDLALIFGTLSKIFIRLRDLFWSQHNRLRSNVRKERQGTVPDKTSLHSIGPTNIPALIKSFDLYSRTNQLILDGFAFAVSLTAAYVIRFEGWPNGADERQLFIWLPPLVFARLAVHWYLGIYRKIWRFVSFSDAVDLAKSIAVVSTILVGLRLFVSGSQSFGAWTRIPLGVIVLEGLLSLTLSLALRALRRTLYARERRMAAASGQSSKRVLLYGAGNAGIMLRRELESNRSYDVVGFVDDDPRKLGTVVSHTTILGRGDDLPRLVRVYLIDEVLVCMRTPSSDVLKRISAKCQESKVCVRVIPSVKELLNRELGESWGNSDITTQSNPVKTSELGERQRLVLVVGGAGYVGSGLVRQLLARKYRVRVLDSLIYGDSGIQELYNRSDFELIVDDSRNVEAVVRACRDVGAVIHLGAIVGDAACALQPSRSVEINLAATKMIVEICKGYGVSRFLFASTCSVYGFSDSIVNEESPTNPISLYASTKLDSERIILNAASPSFHPTILRLATAFGSSYRLRFDLVVNLLAIRALSEKRITVNGGAQWRPFIHVDDIARGFILCLESPLEKVSSQVFNAGSDKLNFTIAELATIIRNHIPNVKVEYTSGGDQRNYHVSFAKIQELLGFECEKGIEDAVFEFKQLFEARLIPDYRDRRYSNHDFLKTQEQDTVHSAEPSLPIAATLKSLSDMQKVLSEPRVASMS